MMTITIAVVVGAAAFFGGMQYQKSQSPVGRFGQFGGRNGQGGFAGRSGNFQGSRPVAGEIISQDDTSVTVKLQDGSSRIIILSDKTVINKAETGSKEDLKTGENIVVFGTENSDKSLTAETILIGGGIFRGLRGPSGQQQ